MTNSPEAQPKCHFCSKRIQGKVLYSTSDEPGHRDCILKDVRADDGPEAQPQGVELLQCPWCPTEQRKLIPTQDAALGLIVHDTDCFLGNLERRQVLTPLGIRLWNTRATASDTERLAAMFTELYNCRTASKCAANDRETFLQLRGQAEAYQDAARRCRELAPRADLPRATVADEERERIIAMADALEYELPNLEQMKGVETLRKKLQAEPARAAGETTVEAALKEIIETANSAVVCVGASRNCHDAPEEAERCAKYVETAVREKAEVLLQQSPASVSQAMFRVSVIRECISIVRNLPALPLSAKPTGFRSRIINALESLIVAQVRATTRTEGER